MRKIIFATILIFAVVIRCIAQPVSTDSAEGSLITKDTIFPFQQQQLKLVSIVAKKKIVEQKIDKTVINVDAGISNAGTSVLDVLEKSPGVSVDKDGNISLKGKQGVHVMIDGRPTYLSAEQLAAVLKGMESSQVDQIELMTNPPAKYDAAGNSGIINIKTKRNRNQGFNGSITSGISQGRYMKANENITLNYRTSKINISANYSLGLQKSFQQLEIHRRYINEEGKTRAVFDQVSHQKSERKNNNLKLGADYFLNKKSTLGITMAGFSNPQSIRATNTSLLKNPSSKIDSIVISDNQVEDRWKNASLNINFRHVYDTSGKELTADVDIIGYEVKNMQDLTNISYTAAMVKKDDENLLGNLPMKIKIYSAKTDFIQPLKNNLKLELGWKSSYVRNESKAGYFIHNDNVITPDYSKTNFFKYEENINAAYINLNKKFSGKISLQTGLRFENTNYKGLQYGNPTRSDSAFNNHYNSLFPTAYLNYQANKNNQFVLSLGRRIDRPRYEDLNPFLFFLDRYTYGSGNPYIKPQYSTNIELAHSFRSFLTTTVNYSRTKNFMAESFDQLGEYTTVQSVGNYGIRDNAGISVSIQWKPAQWISSNIFMNYIYTRLRGMISGEAVDIEALWFNGNMNNQFSFGKGWNGELSGWYMSPSIEGQIALNQLGAVSAGVSKNVLKEKGNIKLAIRDIFYSQPSSGDINFKTTRAYFKSRWDSQQINITFTYRFGKPLNNNSPQRKERQNEEQKRVGNG